MGEEMIHWPWVSRLAFEQVASERDRLRVQNDQLLDHLRRVDRAEHGMSEVPREPRQPQEPMPKSLRAYFNGFADQRMAKMMRDAAYAQHIKQGVPWPDIEREALAEKEEDG